MAYENPYQDTMKYKPRTLWTRPERPRTDWSTFWGKAEEDDTENGDENGYEPEGPESQVVKDAGSELKSLWGDVMADMKEGYDLQQSQNMFDQFQPGITAVTPGTYNPNTATTVPNTQQYVGDWQNPDYTGGDTQPQVYNAGDLNAVTTAAPSGNLQPSANLQDFQPQLGSGFITDVSLPDNYSPAYNQNGPMQTGFVTDIPDWRDMVGVGGLTSNQSQAQLDALVETTAAQDNLVPGNTDWQSGTVNLTAEEVQGLLNGGGVEDEDIDFEDKDWGDFW